MCDKCAVARLSVCLSHHCRASKSALNIITKAMCMDLADKQVECTLVHPGYVATDLAGTQGQGAGGTEVGECSAGSICMLRL